MGLEVGYDESVRTLGPGLALRLSVIERCFELGLSAHELLGADMEWKRLFTTDERQHYTVRSYPARPLPLARYAYRRLMRPALRAVYRRTVALRQDG